MNKIIKITILLISLISNTQQKEIIKIIENYTDNYTKPEYGNEFIKTKLTPALLALEKRSCEKIGTRLFERFLLMRIKTQNNINQIIKKVLGRVFICRTELVEDFLTKKYKNVYLKNILQFGYHFRIEKMKEKPKKLYLLNKRLEKLIKKIILKKWYFKF